MATRGLRWRRPSGLPLDRGGTPEALRYVFGEAMWLTH